MMGPQAKPPDTPSTLVRESTVFPLVSLRIRQTVLEPGGLFFRRYSGFWLSAGFFFGLCLAYTLVIDGIFSYFRLSFSTFEPLVALS